MHLTLELLVGGAGSMRGDVRLGWKVDCPQAKAGSYHSVELRQEGWRLSLGEEKENMGDRGAGDS